MIDSIIFFVSHVLIGCHVLLVQVRYSLLVEDHAHQILGLALDQFFLSEFDPVVRLQPSHGTEDAF